MSETQMKVATSEDLNKLMDMALESHFEFLKLNQEQVNKIFYAASFAANSARIPLAQQAVIDTGMGVVEDKVIKNNYASEYIFNRYKNEKTVGLISEDKINGKATYAEPLGILAGIIPTTNPTSTVIFKCLIALKTRNCIVISPHPRAAKCSIEAARIVRDAAIANGAPKNCISWITDPSVALSGELMKHKLTSCILATGGPAMVTAAYSSGNPALGVGPGNNCAIIDELCNIKDAVSSIILSKTFDNGMICASEQSCVVVDSVYEQIKEEFKYRGCFFLNKEETAKIGDFCLPINPKTGIRGLNPAAVGQPARKIAEMAGVSVPAEHPCKVLIGEDTNDHIGHTHAMSLEKLAPVLGMFKAKNFDEALEVASKCIHMAGKGHTGSIHTAFEAQDRINKFAQVVQAGRLIVNQPSAHGGIGDLYNFTLDPTLTIGCGSHGGNSVSQNVGCQHLLNYKNVVVKRENCLWFKSPPKIYFKYGCLTEAIKDLYHFKRCFIITDKILFDLGYTDNIIKPLEAKGIKTTIFSEVAPDPDLACCSSCLKLVKAFKPDCFIALGGGSAMDLMKMVRLQYEHGDADFIGLAQRFADIRKRIYEFPELLDLKKVKTYSVCIPTSSGTGAEVTPFAVITDNTIGVKYPLADYMLVPQMAIVDSSLAMTMPRFLAAWTGVDALTHAIESYVSLLATEFTQPLSLQAMKLIFQYLPESCNKVTKESREAIHHAATIAGMAFGNAFLGICHSMAHKLGQKFHVPHGLANAICLCPTIKFNSTDVPTKMGAFPQYKYPQAIQRYGEIVDYLGFKPKVNTPMGKVECLIENILELYKQLDVSPYIKDFRNAPTKEQYVEALDYLSYHAFDDQCTGANPRYPLIAELKEVLATLYEPSK
ncbi:Bifunctional acetaldehyde-CoA/alcohol dehydrogenase [Spironucleus salmonicida]|uniref:Aldehyde-alcohol dehydrogenase n=1 Tax=Spironucleus salmonicida TaxID=348837 RepID=K7R8N2_9EUKA|nr:alcohol dehydrogenase E [Spironucleus salmonicida]KAH0577890.1 Bifunctional acetaldehyde-CoA/alcohol dehydrogenase [Spironucleus salmonicida]|eukprot:EST44017.1 Alcohol dehydrogenase E [Spironucleus salmonicida]